MRCEHDPNIMSAQLAHDVLRDGDVIVDIWCKKCGKSGSAKVQLSDFLFDEECEEECKASPLS